MIPKSLGFKYNPYEDRILKTLLVAYRPLTARQISQFSRISYNTTRSYLNKLSKTNKIITLKKGSRTYWGILRE